MFCTTEVSSMGFCIKRTHSMSFKKNTKGSLHPYFVRKAANPLQSTRRKERGAPEKERHSMLCFSWPCGARTTAGLLFLFHRHQKKREREKERGPHYTPQKYGGGGTHQRLYVHALYIENAEEAKCVCIYTTYSVHGTGGRAQQPPYLSACHNRLV